MSVCRFSRRTLNFELRPGLTICLIAAASNTPRVEAWPDIYVRKRRGRAPFRSSISCWQALRSREALCRQFHRRQKQPG